jgi:hypothetical protein
MRGCANANRERECETSPTTCSLHFCDGRSMYLSVLAPDDHIHVYYYWSRDIQNQST